MSHQRMGEIEAVRLVAQPLHRLPAVRADAAREQPVMGLEDALRLLVAGALQQLGRIDPGRTTQLRSTTGLANSACTSPDTGIVCHRTSCTCGPPSATRPLPARPFSVTRERDP
jgi:hypothetical protein